MEKAPSPVMKLQFSIRLALLATLVTSIVLAFYAHHLRFLERRLRAMSLIERDSGFVTFRNVAGGMAVDITDDVRRRDRVESIYLAGSKLNDQTLKLLATLNEVRFVSFNSSAFEDRHVGYLDRLTNLRELQLNGTEITKAGLEHLSRRHRLSQLTLNDTSIDDDSVNALAKMNSLQKLYLRNTNISNEGLDMLHTKLSKCKIVH